MTAKPADDPARFRDLARLRGLTSLHMPHPDAPIGPALVHMTPDDRTEALAIIDRLANQDDAPDDADM
jgi:hypothetical protein